MREDLTKSIGNRFLGLGLQIVEMDFKRNSIKNSEVKLWDWVGYKLEV